MVEQVYDSKTRKWVIFDGDYVLEYRPIKPDSGVSVVGFKNLLDMHTKDLIDSTISFEVDHYRNGDDYYGCEYRVDFNIAGKRLPTEQELALREKHREEVAKNLAKQEANEAKQATKAKAAKEARDKKEYERLRKKFETPQKKVKVNPHEYDFDQEYGLK